jgi:hypothetical protein
VIRQFLDSGIATKVASTRPERAREERDHGGCIVSEMAGRHQRPVRRRAHDRLATGPVPQTAQEGAVDLQDVDREALQVGQRGASGPEAVYRQPQAECLSHPTALPAF